jgi:hypothetical protein
VEVPEGGGVGVCFVSFDDCFEGALPRDGAGSARIEPNDFTSTLCAIGVTFDGEEDSCAFASPIDPKLSGVLEELAGMFLGMVTLSLLGGPAP